jgi:sugar phosphate permease
MPGSLPGWINTSQQVGGAIAVAVATTLAAGATESYVEEHPGTNALSAAALTHGYEVTYYVCAAVLAVAAILSALILESKPAESQAAPVAEAAPEPGAA